MVFQSSSKQVSRRFQGSFEGVLRVFLGYFRESSRFLRLYKGCFDFDRFLQDVLRRNFIEIFKGDKGNSNCLVRCYVRCDIYYLLVIFKGFSKNSSFNGLIVLKNCLI